MSSGEQTILVISVVAALGLWWRWLVRLWRPTRLAGGAAQRGLLVAAAVCGFAALGFVLRCFASHDVRDDPRYLAFYAALGAAWAAVVIQFLDWLGLSARDDVAERRNGAAAVALSGALGAAFLCFAGANIGNGPGFWVVLFSAALSTAGLLLAWLLVEWGGAVGELITVERDRAAGLRLAAFLIAGGAVLGRAVAGDWVSAEQTARDFARFAWPVLILVAVEIWISRVARPTRAHAVPNLLAAGVLPAAFYLSAAGWYLVERGWW